MLYHNVLVFSSFKFILTCDYCLYQSQSPSALHQCITPGTTVKLKFSCDLLSYGFPALNVSFHTLFGPACTGVYQWHFFISAGCVLGSVSPGQEGRLEVSKSEKGLASSFLWFLSLLSLSQQKPPPWQASFQSNRAVSPISQRHTQQQDRSAAL